MSGLINSPAPSGPALGNSLLQQAEDRIESHLTPENRENYLKIVVAGMRAALDKGQDSVLASLRQSKDPISDAAKGAIGLVQALRKQSKGIMPPQAMVPAATTLMLKALDFVDRTGIVKVGQPELVRAMHILTDTIFAQFGITKQKLSILGTKVHQLTQDPQAMQKMNIKAGIERHPQARQVGA